MSELRRRALAAAAVATLGVALPGAAGGRTLAAGAFTSSTITQPGDGAELFYDADDGSGAITVTGTAGPSSDGQTGDLLCYSAPGTAPFTVATDIPVTGGSFSADVSLRPIASRVCRLRLVPHGSTPDTSAAQSFAGPRVSVSEQASRSSHGNVYGYYILAGTLPWSFGFSSLGECPINASYATDPDTLGSFLLFSGGACLPASSGTGTARGMRSSVQVDGLNAYPPGAIPTLTGVAGFAPLTYTAAFDAFHDTVTIDETDDLVVCQAPGGFPPTAPGNCPGLVPAGIRVSQTTTLLPGGQVTRLAQRFTSDDGRAHTVDLLFSDAVTSPALGETPGFELPGQSEYASHAYPDSFTLFPAGPGSIYAIAHAGAPPATANPIGAITYGRPPLDADFVSVAGARTAVLLTHYQEHLGSRGAVTLTWAFSEASSATGLAPLVAVETDRYYRPSLRLIAPRRRIVRDSPLIVRGIVRDRFGVSSVSVDGAGAPVGAGGRFAARVRLRRGLNRLTVLATNLAGNLRSVTRRVLYRPAPCVVPRLGGRPLAAARRLLRRHGCRSGAIVRRHSRAVPRGRVIASHPRAGSRRRHGARVRLVISAGR